MQNSKTMKQNSKTMMQGINFLKGEFCKGGEKLALGGHCCDHNFLQKLAFFSQTLML
jgi:hypothetical protein